MLVSSNLSQNVSGGRGCRQGLRGRSFVRSRADLPARWTTPLRGMFARGDLRIPPRPRPAPGSLDSHRAVRAVAPSSLARFWGLRRPHNANPLVFEAWAELVRGRSTGRMEDARAAADHCYGAADALPDDPTPAPATSSTRPPWLTSTCSPSCLLARCRRAARAERRHLRSARRCGHRSEALRCDTRSLQVGRSTSERPGETGGCVEGGSDVHVAGSFLDAPSSTRPAGRSGRFEPGRRAGGSAPGCRPGRLAGVLGLSGAGRGTIADGAGRQVGHDRIRPGEGLLRASL